MAGAVLVKTKTWQILSVRLAYKTQAMARAKVNPYVFVPMGRVPCTPRAVIASVKQRYRAPIDGLLFYHNEGHVTYLSNSGLEVV